MADDDGYSWEREDTHFPDRMSRWGAELFMTRQSRGIAEICADTGFLFDEVRTAEIDGWAYATVVPLGGKVRRPPPNWLVPLLVRIVPDLRRRIATMRNLERTNYWEGVVDSWLSGDEDALLADGVAILDTDPSGLSDGELADLLAETWTYAERAVKKHFHLHGAGINEIMRLSMVLNREHGFTTAELSGLLTGLSDTTTGPAAAQAEIIDLIRANDGEPTLRTATSLDTVRAIAPEVDAAITRYMASWGRRAIRYEIAYPTIAESPEWVLDILRSQIDRPSAAELADRHRDTRSNVEHRVLAALGDTEETRARIERARRAFPIREGNEAATVGVPAAALRHVGQEAGRRLAASDHLDDAGHVFDALPAEVDAVLRGHADPGLATRALDRHTERLSPVTSPPPRTKGPELALPDLSGFPDDIQEAVESVLWFSSKASTIQTGIADADDVATSAADESASASTIVGMGVAPGTYEGPARIVLDETGFDKIEPGDVLVCPITSPVWSMLFPSLGALVCDNGGPLSHPAIIAREFGIPAVVATDDATTALVDGQPIRVDGAAGTVVAIG
ncbi:MAG: PEP-utilizing enzyme [Actinomycetota bacterium]